MSEPTTSTAPPEPDKTPSGLIFSLEALSVLRSAIYVGGIVACVYFGVTVPVRETAGQTTVISLFYRVIGDFKLHAVISYATAASFYVLWRRERKIRIEAVGREHRRVEALERHIDPNRTSSGFEE